MGSGVLICLAIEHYGIDNFEKIMISNHKTRRAMFIAERKLITKSVVLNKNCYNLITGGKRRSKNTFQVKAKYKNCQELLNVNNRRNRRKNKH